MRPKFFIKLNLISTIVFLLILIVILIFVDPFQANLSLILIFYLSLFFSVFGILNILRNVINMPIWCRILISATLIAVLILQKKF